AAPRAAGAGPEIGDAPGAPRHLPAAAAALIGAAPAGVGTSLVVAAVLAALFVLASPPGLGARAVAGGRRPPDTPPARDERPG
ncbi:MAG TPA: hypothetical protein VL422_18030, partial [Miltoncostaea sp.]|nr:hypothetical protein [Miltoncostaea sp.]